MPESVQKREMNESSRTTATVLIDTHDRGKHHGSQQLNISEYITQVTIDSHIAGGGAANITLPATDYYEDIIAAGDLINIYLDTHRDNDNVYNRGNVRVFFGYVDSISKSISVGGEGAKLTTYTILCQDFAKAIRSTDIYNNPFLSQQSGEGLPDVVREEMKHNLGGLTVFAHGMAYEGTPRDVVIQNTMRCLGMGGQWVLPQHYSEGLPGSKHNVFFDVESKSENVDSSKTRTADLLEESLFPDQIRALMRDEGNQVLMAEVDKLLADPQLDFAEVEELVKKLETLIGESTAKFDARIDQQKGKVSHRPYLSNTFFKVGPALKGRANTKESSYESFETNLKPVIEAIITKVSIESRSVQGKFKLSPLVNHLADPATGKNDQAVAQPALTIFNILCLDYLEDVDGYWGDLRWMKYQGNLYGATLENGNTIINELFFDLRPSPIFDNSVTRDGLGVKTNGAMPMVPAVVLREKPFTNYPPQSQQILNYEPGNAIRVGTLDDLVGDDQEMLKNRPPEPTTEKTKPYKHKPNLLDQLFLSTNSSGGMISRILASEEVAITKFLSQLKFVEGQLGKLLQRNIPYVGAYNFNLSERIHKGEFALLKDKSDPEVQTHLAGLLVENYPWDVYNALYKKFLPEGSLDALVGGISPDNMKKIEEIVATLAQLTVEDRTFLKNTLSSHDAEKVLVSSNLKQPLVKQHFGSIISLPRPVFRSPDGTRITKEKKISHQQHVLGTLYPTKEGGELAFTALSTFSRDHGADLSAYYPKVETEYELHLLAPGSGRSETRKTLKEALQSRWHCLDFMTIYPDEVMVETQSRGDNNVVNFCQLTAAGLAPEAQKFTLNNLIPIITPISVQRFGVRVKAIQTKFIDILNLGGGPIDDGGDRYEWSYGLLMRWNVLLDMWAQHNHEYVSSSMTLRGMPGLRVGYRVDRPDLNLSFYVDQVSHTWTYPGYLSTQISASRGQPTAGFKTEFDIDGNAKRTSKILKYYPPEPNVNSNKQQRQKLGQIFTVGETKTGKRKAPPGTYTGQSLYSKVKSREEINETQAPPGPKENPGDLPKE